MSISNWTFQNDSLYNEEIIIVSKKKVSSNASCTLYLSPRRTYKQWIQAVKQLNQSKTQLLEWQIISSNANRKRLTIIGDSLLNRNDQNKLSNGKFKDRVKNISQQQQRIYVVFQIMKNVKTQISAHGWKNNLEGNTKSLLPSNHYEKVWSANVTFSLI